MNNNWQQYKKINRLQNYDYSQPGLYFVTICTKNGVHHFGHVNNGVMCLNESGSIVMRQWQWLAEQYPYVILDEFVVMPNHVHGVIIIDNQSDNMRCTRRSRPAGTEASQKNLSLSNIIGAFKTTSSKLIHQYGSAEFRWHRSFYDHVIRNYGSLERIRWYISHNPELWKKDKYKINH